MVPDQNKIEDISRNCLLSASRRLSRLVTSIYDEAFRPHEIKASQFSLLVVIARAGPVRRSDISRYADIDPSTLTRNLAVMTGAGWIEEVISGVDGRGNPLRLTRKGGQLLDTVTPDWERAQERARGLLRSGAVGSLALLFEAASQSAPG